MSSPRIISSEPIPFTPPALIVERRDNGPGGLLPESYHTLSCYEPTRFFHRDYGYRSPTGIYTVSLAEVWPAFNTLLDELMWLKKRHLCFSETVPEEVHECTDRILVKTRNLLYSLFEHLENCVTIIQCCFPPGQKCGKSTPYTSYKASVLYYRDRLGKIVNSIKHNQRRLRFFRFYGAAWVAPGYYVEAPLGGALGPDPNIHSWAATAFSFAWDLRHHFVSIFMISHYLSLAVGEIMGPPSGIMIDKPGDDAEVAGIALRIRNLRFMFPDEEERCYPAIDCRKEHQVRVLRLLYLSGGSVPAGIPETFKYSAHWRGDGETRSFLLPYSNPRHTMSRF